MTSKFEKSGEIAKGMVFGRLTARATDPENPKSGAHWWFHCSCGQYTSKRITSVLYGRTTSCGCKRADYLADRGSEMRQYKSAVAYAKKHLSESQVKHIDKLLRRKVDGNG